MAGSDVVLTIDANLQAITEKALENAIVNANSISPKAKDSDAGAIVVMNVNTGEVLSMASYPYYDPSEWIGGIKQEVWDRYRADESNRPLINRAIASAYAPGSTFKMVTAVAALQTGNVTISEKINDVGVYPRGHKPTCWIYSSRHVGHGYINLSNAIKHSCNYYFYEMGYRIGIETLDRYARAFGLGSKTGIELMEETAGSLASPELAEKRGETWTVGYTLSASIGQEANSFTPLQMAKYISILVNGGKQINPTIVKSVINADGTEIKDEELRKSLSEKLGIEPNNNEDIEISQENLDAIMDGMKGVTSESGGTAYGVFGHFNIEVGGKTGTAQRENKGDSANAWFVGFAPYDNPEIAVVCIIENGGDSSIASYPARDIIAQYFGMNVENIDEDITARPTTETQR